MQKKITLGKCRCVVLEHSSLQHYIWMKVKNILIVLYLCFLLEWVAKAMKFHLKWSYLLKILMWVWIKWLESAACFYTPHWFCTGQVVNVRKLISHYYVNSGNYQWNRIMLCFNRSWESLETFWFKAFICCVWFTKTCLFLNVLRGWSDKKGFLFIFLLLNQLW